MTWQLARIHYFSHDGRRRDLVLKADAVNIITGPSGTGKSAVIQTIDYCMGSRDCSIPRYVQDRVVGVAIVWTNGASELLVARDIPTVGRRSTDAMRVLHGTEVSVPHVYDELTGGTNRATVKRYYQEILGIGDAYQEGTEEKPTRITVRHLMPFLFLSKGVIDSETVLLHGMDDKEHHDDIVRAFPYFMGAADEDSVHKSAELKGLRAALLAAERRLQREASHEKSEAEVARSLLFEAAQVGLARAPAPNESLSSMLSRLHGVQSWRPEDAPRPDALVMGELSKKQEELLGKMDRIHRRIRRAERDEGEVTTFERTLGSQAKKLEVVKLFAARDLAHSCPVCGSDVESASDQLLRVREAFARLSDQKSVVSKQRPQLRDYVRELKKSADALSEELATVRTQLNALVWEDEVTAKKYDYNQRATRVVGRVSYYLEHNVPTGRQSQFAAQVEELRERIATIGGEYDDEARRARLQLVDHLISKEATEIFSRLPRVEPCDTASLIFTTERVRLGLVTEDGYLPWEQVGSDQNYLALHISLILALHQVLARRERPVPGFIVLDQVSRPYFPPTQHPDEVALLAEGPDEETVALRKHFQVLFEEVEKRRNLQLLVLEHAYFADDQRYLDAIRYRWKKEGEKLIPADWPRRSVEPDPA